MIIYIAGPYSQGDVTENVRRACFAADVLLSKGHMPFIPHLSMLYHLISPKKYEDWIQIGLAFLGRCDAMLRLPGESKGADLEVEIANKMGIKVYYDLEDICSGTD